MLLVDLNCTLVTSLNNDIVLTYNLYEGHPISPYNGLISHERFIKSVRYAIIVRMLQLFMGKIWCLFHI